MLTKKNLSKRTILAVMYPMPINFPNSYNYIIYYTRYYKILSNYSTASYVTIYILFKMIKIMLVFVYTFILSDHTEIKLNSSEEYTKM